jgi:hypothetical protein
MRFAFIIDLEVNAHRVGALFVLAHIFEHEQFARPRLAATRRG